MYPETWEELCEYWNYICDVCTILDRGGDE